MNEQIFDQLGFTLEFTADGSPTLRLKETSRIRSESSENLPTSGESMHHSAGAFSETAYIYGPLLDWSFKEFSQPHILSVGLGLGYNEIYTAAIAELNSHHKWSLDSFEIVQGLRDHFVQCLETQAHFETSVYGHISRRLSEHLNLEPGKIFQQLNRALSEKRLQIFGDIRSFQFEKKYNAILQDAFSRKTNPDLWEENFLVQLLTFTHPKSALASYASLGPLKRSLKQMGFESLNRDGYHGKRNCTLASRGEKPLFILQNLSEELKVKWKIS
jgi:hypothetical protein